MVTTTQQQQQHGRSHVVIVLIAIALAVTFGFSVSSSSLQDVQPGDIVVITGSSTGIGKDAALSLAREGFTVFACVRKRRDGQALIQEHLKQIQQVENNKETHDDNHDSPPAAPQETNGNIKILIMDVTNSDQITQAVTTVTNYIDEAPPPQQRRFRGLFNNAGIGGESAEGTTSSAIQYTDMSDYRKVFDVNYFGLVEVTKAFLPLLRKYPNSRILMNTSVAGFIAGPFMASYASSKHAVEGFSDALRRELYPLGVKVSILECAYIKTAIASMNIPQGMEHYKQAEQEYWKWFWHKFLSAPTPGESSSKVIVHAMRSKHPNIRYLTGKDSTFLMFARYLPGSISDVLCRLVLKYEGKIQNHELMHLMKDEHLRPPPQKKKRRLSLV